MPQRIKTIRKWSVKPLLFIIPGIILLWSLYLQFHLGPYYLRSIDPEYMYLVSGVHSATLDFNKIGHIDHPGTPLQLLSGIIFRIIHLFAGHDDIITDVISEPELYLSASSLILTLISCWMLLHLGMLVLKHTKRIQGAIVLQAFSFYSVVGMGIYFRYSPDRLLSMIVLLFFIFYIRYLYDRKFNVRKFALMSGIVMGAGLATKYNFLPLLIMPLILIPDWKNRGRYILSGLFTTGILFLPISSKYREFIRIIREMITHTGLYGSGTEGIIDRSSFLTNIADIFHRNPSFTIIVALGGACLLILIIKPGMREKGRYDLRFLAASLIAVALGLVMTAKHYKAYYALPILSLMPMILYTAIRLFDRIFRFRYNPVLFTALLAVILFFPVRTTIQGSFNTNEDLQNKKSTEAFIRDHITPRDYFLVQPIWMATPMQENAMVLGVSYLHHRERSYLKFENIYPRILTWEGNDMPLRHMRMRDTPLEPALLSGGGIHLYSKPGWNAPQLGAFIESTAREAGISIQCDTVYANERIDEYIIRYMNADGWRKVEDLNCGFENYSQDQLLTNNGQTPLKGDFMIRNDHAAHGDHSLLLDQERRTSPGFTLEGIEKGDVILSSVKTSLDPADEIMNVRIRCGFTDRDGNRVVLESAPSPGRVDENWYMSDLFATIGSQPADSTLTCYVEYTGTMSVRLDDFVLQLFSKNTSYRQ